MTNLFKRLISGYTLQAPENIRQLMSRAFPDAMNIEWYLHETGYEAVFYQHDLETIARFDDQGNLQKYKTNLPLQAVPELIMQEAGRRGEVMNVVEIHQGLTLSYEVIWRNRRLKRSLMILDAKGEILSETAL